MDHSNPADGYYHRAGHMKRSKPMTKREMEKKLLMVGSTLEGLSLQVGQSAEDHGSKMLGSISSNLSILADHVLDLADVSLQVK